MGRSGKAHVQWRCPSRDLTDEMEPGMLIQAQGIADAKALRQGGVCPV